MNKNIGYLFLFTGGIGIIGTIGLTAYGVHLALFFCSWTVGGNCVLPIALVLILGLIIGTLFFLILRYGQKVIRRY